VWKRVPSVWPFHQVKNCVQNFFICTSSPDGVAFYRLWRRCERMARVRYSRAERSSNSPQLLFECQDRGIAPSGRQLAPGADESVRFVERHGAVVPFFDLKAHSPAFEEGSLYFFQEHAADASSLHGGAHVQFLKLDQVALVF